MTVCVPREIDKRWPSAEGRWSGTVVSVTPEEDELPVYDLEVDEFHTYFVGTFGVWVHNKAGR